MSKNIIVNVQNRETRVAVVEDGKLAEVYIERENQIVGSIYKCKVQNVLAGIDAAFVDIGTEKNAFLYSGDILTKEDYSDSSKQKRNNKVRSIHNLITEGQELLVQVVKAPRGTKGARVSTKVTLPGRYLVVIPNSNIIGISKRITDAERNRLKSIIERIKPKNFGIIVRTEAEDISEKELLHDINIMLKIWNNIQAKEKTSIAPAVIYKELSLIYQTIRDTFTNEITNMYIDTENEYKKALDIIDFFAPKLKNKLKLYKEDAPIFERFGIEHQYMQLFKRKIWLESGGYICIDHAEALTVIDVNSGKFVGNKSLQETVVITNLEAAKEIARQIRMRDIGGIIVIDFIDMQNNNDKQLLIKKLDQQLKKERTKATISHVSSLGLIELTRKRVIDTISETVTAVCPYCNGRGRIESAETVSLRIERELRNFITKNTITYGCIINLNPNVGTYLIGDTGENIKDLEKLHGISIYVRGHSDMHIEDFKIVNIKQEIIDTLMPLSMGQVYTTKPTRSVLSLEDKAYTWIEDCLIEIPYAAKYSGKQIKITIKEVNRNVSIAKVKI